MHGILRQNEKQWQKSLGNDFFTVRGRGAFTLICDISCSQALFDLYTPALKVISEGTGRENSFPFTVQGIGPTKLKGI